MSRNRTSCALSFALSQFPRLYALASSQKIKPPHPFELLGLAYKEAAGNMPLLAFTQLPLSRPRPAMETRTRRKKGRLLFLAPTFAGARPGRPASGPGWCPRWRACRRARRPFRAPVRAPPWPSGRRRRCCPGRPRARRGLWGRRLPRSSYAQRGRIPGEAWCDGGRVLDSKERCKEVWLHGFARRTFVAGCVEG
jgi:hypothetical protein